MLLGLLEEAKKNSMFTKLFFLGGGGEVGGEFVPMNNSLMEDFE